MRKFIYLVSLLTLLISCNTEKPLAFPEEVLNEEFLNLKEETITFKEILSQYKGKKMLIETCASWCVECVSGIPNVKKLKEKYPDVVFVFLSVDKSTQQWKEGIDRFFNIEGGHYFLPSSLKGGFAKGLEINDVPHYMVVNEKGIVSLAKVTESFDPRIEAALK